MGRALAGVALCVCGLAAPASAQIDPALLRDHPGVGVGVGFTGNGDANSDGSGAVDLSAHLDIPLAMTWRVRAEMGSARWTFAPQVETGEQPRGQRVRLTRVTVGLVHAIIPKRRSSRLGIDVTGGLGLYEYGLPAGTDGAATQFGVHGGIAFDYPLRNDRVAFGAEIRIHAARGPGATTPVFSDILFVGVGALTARVSFP